MQSRSHRILKKILKTIAWTIMSVVLLLIVLALVIQIPPVQEWITQRAVSFLEEKIGTKVSLGGISIGFPKSIILEECYLEDQRGDTLLYAGSISLNTDLWALTRNEVQLNTINLTHIAAFIDRKEHDSAFNFTYIIDAFAGDSTGVPDTLEQDGWNITMETLELEDIRLLFDDRLEGNYVNLSLGRFELNMRAFDLENNTFGVKDVTLEDTRATVKQTKLLPPVEETEEREDSAAALVFSLEECLLRNVGLNYEQKVLGQRASINLGEIRILADKIDLEGQEIALNKVFMANSRLALHSAAPDTVLPEKSNDEKQTTQSDEGSWKVTLKNLQLEENAIEFFDLTQPYIQNAVDFNHLSLSAINAEATDIGYDSENIQAHLANFSFREQSGFELKSLSGTVNIAERHASVEDLLLLTGNSRMGLNAQADYPSFKDISTTWQRAELNADINNSYVNIRDILYFNPFLLDSLPLTLPPDANIHFDAAVAGSIKSLELRHFNVRSLSDTYLNTAGRITGLPDAVRLGIDMKIDKFHTTRVDIEKILPDTLLPDSIQLPAWIDLKAHYRGGLQKSQFTTDLTSDVGAVEMRGDINLDSASASRGFNIALNVNNLDVGSILRQPDSIMNTLGLRAAFKARGLSPDEMDGKLNVVVDHFSYNGYQYRGLALDGTIKNRIASLNALMEDENLDFTIDADYIFAEDVPKYNFNLDLKNADFGALHLTPNPIRARGALAVDLETSDFKVLNGNVGIRKVAIFNGNDLYAIDSLLFASIDQEGRSEINIDSDLLQARFEGSFNIFGLPSVLREYFHTYYALHDSLDVKDTPPQHFRFMVELRNTDLFTELLIPELTTFEPGPITGEFDSRTQQLDIRVGVDAIHYGNIAVDSFTFVTNSDSGSLKYNLVVDKVMVDSMRIDGIELNGTVANNSIATRLSVLDSTDRDKYVISGTLLSQEDGFEARLSPRETMLNYDTWTVPEDNFMRFGGEKVVIQNLELANGREKIIIHSDETPGTPIEIGFRQLNVEHLTSMIAEERLASGLLHGDINLFPSTTGLTFTSDLSITRFSIRDISWGDIALQVAQQTGNRFDVNFSLKGDANNVTVSGLYNGGTSPSMDITANVQRFDLKSLQPLLIDQVRDLTGQLQGEVRATGTPQEPDIDGKLLLRKTTFFPTFLNTGFSLDNETISFVDEGVSFNNFEVADQAGNIARLNGTIITRGSPDYRLRLDLVTDNFRLLNTTKDDNDLFYGKVDLKATARIRGTTNTPIVDVDIGLAKGSNLTYIVPQTEASALEAEGIVKFVDRSFEGDPFMKQVNDEAADTVKATFRGIDLTARIELTGQETFTIVIDPVTQDQLSIKGNSSLTLKVDPTGNINLTGRYEIREGTYNLTFYKFVKRVFAIEKGSYITWLGDPMNAQMDIRAIYNVETSPIELFSNQLTGAAPNEVNQYKQRLPFMVYLLLSGELLQPEVAFKLEMPTERQNAFGGNVYARLKDINTRESDLNKQVFSLLILKRFISDDPFENKAGGGLSSTARNSVSKILSDQLNRLSDNIKGIELSFDVKSYEDYTSGEAQGQTELELGVSKSLLNDRLVVKLSGNVDVEGQNSNRSATDYIGDLALEYKITPDGRFRITGFRNSNYDMIDGELIETGAGLIYVKDYNALRELFKANAETKEK